MSHIQQNQNTATFTTTQTNSEFRIHHYKLTVPAARRDTMHVSLSLLQHDACDVGRIMSKLSTYSDLARFTRCQRVFYNRVPKCGSRTVLSTFKILARSLHFTVASSGRYGRRSHFGNVSLMVSGATREREVTGYSNTERGMP